MNRPLIRSSIPGIIFPSIPGQEAAVQMALQFQFEQSQWWPQKDLVDYQFNQLRHLLNFAFRHSSFWKEKAEEAGLNREWIKKLTPKTLSQLPILKRSELQQQLDKIRPKQTPKEHGPLSQTKTSGSTSTPITAYGTGVTRALWHAFSIRDHLWHKRDFRLKLAAIRSVPMDVARAPNGIVKQGWATSVGRVFASGQSMMLNVTEPVHVQYKWLLKHNPHYLITHPSNLMALARHAKGASKKLTNLRQIRGVGEIVTQTLRDEVDAVFGCKIADMYSCQESGYIALQCPEKGNYHVMSEGIYLEVVDDKGRPLPPGKQGRVLITNLNNFATPMIRYELGDMAVFGQPCSCGRGLPVLDKILGRVRNMVVMPDGSTHWPYFGFSDFIKVADIRQFQIIQHDLETVEFKLVTDHPLSVDQEKKITSILQKSLTHPFSIRFTYLDHIPKSKSGKYEDFISKVPQF